MPLRYVSPGWVVLIISSSFSIYTVSLDIECLQAFPPNLCNRLCMNPIVLSRFVLFLYCGPLHVGCGQRIINHCPFTVCPVFCVDV